MRKLLRPYLVLKTCPSCRYKRDGPAVASTSTLANENFIEFMQSKYRSELAALNSKLCQAASAHYAVDDDVKRKRGNAIAFIRKRLTANSDRLLVRIGSEGSGLASSGSDIDLVLLTSGNTAKRERMSESFQTKFVMREYMRSVERIVGSTINGQEAQYMRVHLARVPVLTITAGKMMKIDIQFNNEASIRNTSFVRQCVLLDPRVRILIFWANEWLRAMKLKDSKKGLFSSYHITMLVLHFLQNFASGEVRPVLPLIYERFASKVNQCVPIEKIAESLNSDLKLSIPSKIKRPSLSQLILRFIQYYSALDLRECGISVKTAEVIIPSRDGEDLRLWIEDPYEDGTICNVTNGADRFMEAVNITKSAMIDGKGISWPIDLS